MSTGRSAAWVCPLSGRGLAVVLNAQTEPLASVLAAEVAGFLRWTAPVAGALFVFGGRAGRLGDARQYLKSVEFLDPTLLEWRRAPDMSYARVGLAACYLNGSYYVIGGYNQINGDPQKSVERLCSVSMQWTACASLLVPRYGHSACACGGKIYVMGGDHSGVLIPFAERYDPESDSWERLPDMPIRVAASRAVSMDGKVFLFGGCDPSVPGDRASDAILMFDPAVGRWTILANKMTTGRTAFSLAPTVGGVVIAGGFDLSTRPETEMKSVEVIRLGERIKILDHQTTTADLHYIENVPELPLPRAGCQGVSIPTNLLPPAFRQASALPMVVLGGEYVDSASGICRIFDSVTMLVNRDFTPIFSSAKSAKCGGGLGSLVRNLSAFKKRRTPSEDSSTSTMVWSDSVLPPMDRKRTAFAACVGDVWPRGFKYLGRTDFDETSTEDSLSEYAERSRERSRSMWPDMLHDWLQGNVL